MKKPGERSPGRGIASIVLAGDFISAGNGSQDQFGIEKIGATCEPTTARLPPGRYGLVIVKLTLSA
jgi:hypothetical protein